MVKRYKSLIRFIPPLIWMGLIFFASSQHKIGMGGSYWVSFAIFKTLHMIIYGLLYLFWYLALYNSDYNSIYAIVISALYGLTDEIHQSFVPTREGTLRDVIINFIGIIIFVLFLRDFIINQLKKITIFQKIYPYS